MTDLLPDQEGGEVVHWRREAALWKDQFNEVVEHRNELKVEVERLREDRATVRDALAGLAPYLKHTLGVTPTVDWPYDMCSPREINPRIRTVLAALALISDDCAAFDEEVRSDA